MRFKSSKLICLLLTLLLSVNLFTACSNDKKEVNVSDKEGKVTTAQKGSEDKVDEGKTKERKKFTFWAAVHADVLKNVKNIGNTEWYKKVEEATNVDIEFIHPAIGQEKEQFNLLIASGEYYDAISGMGYPGGVEKAIKDKVYLPLNDILPEHAPDYWNMINASEDCFRQVSTREGVVPSFVRFCRDKGLAWTGPIVRNDLLKKYNLEVPETIEDWEKVLYTFKDNGVEIPIYFNPVDWRSYTSPTILSAFGINLTFYQVDGKVNFGPMQQSYKEYLTLLNKWYNDGILDKDFATRDGKSSEAAITNGKVGMLINSEFRLGLFENAGKDIIPDFDILPIANPTMVKGEKNKLKLFNGYNKGCSTYITTSCKDPEALAEWFNYFYTDEGSLLTHVGIEGVSYKMVEGKVKTLKENPQDGSKILMGQYNMFPNFPMRLLDVKDTLYDTDDLIKCVQVWDEDGEDYILPPASVLGLNEEETETSSAIINEVNNMVKEMTLKFIMGTESLDNFDNFVDQLKRMKIEEVVSIYQTAYDRYLAK